MLHFHDQGYDYYSIFFIGDPTSFDQRLPEFTEILDTMKFDGAGILYRK